MRPHDVHLHFVDVDPRVVAALRAAFAVHAEVEVRQGDLLRVATNAVVSPANGEGFMDGGIDAAYVAYFGRGVEDRVREAIARRPERRLPVGASVVVNTGDARVPYLIVAATMIGPEAVSASNCYRAMRAVLRAAGADGAVGRTVYCPGLGTGVGMVDPEEAAGEMARAYADWRKARGW